MPKCWHCQAEFTEEHHLRIVYGTAPLYGPWMGWRTAGRYLIGPGGVRVTPERLRGLLWAEEQRKRVCRRKDSLHPNIAVLAKRPEGL